MHSGPLRPTVMFGHAALRSLARMTFAAALSSLVGLTTALAEDAPSPAPTMLSRKEITDIFALLASDQPARFYDHVADDVHWTVLGTHPLAGSFSSKAAFQEADVKPIGALFDKPLKVQVRRILIDGDVAVAELFSHATTKDGLPYDNTYCWICRFENGKIVEVRASVDSALVAKVIQAREDAK